VQRNAAKQAERVQRNAAKQVEREQQQLAAVMASISTQFDANLVDSQESLTGEDRPELSGITKEVTERNNTDHILDRHINWQ
jgi:hypothetical protein